VDPEEEESWAPEEEDPDAGFEPAFDDQAPPDESEAPDNQQEGAGGFEASAEPEAAPEAAEFAPDPSLEQPFEDPAKPAEGLEALTPDAPVEGPVAPAPAPGPELADPLGGPAPVAQPLAPEVPFAAAPQMQRGPGVWQGQEFRQFSDPMQSRDPAAVQAAQGALQSFLEHTQSQYSQQGYNSAEHMRQVLGGEWYDQVKELATGRLDSPKWGAWEPNVGWNRDYAPRQQAMPQGRSAGAPAPAPAARGPQAPAVVARNFDPLSPGGQVIQGISQQLRGAPGGTAYHAGPQRVEAPTVATNAPGSPGMAAITAAMQGQPAGTALHSGRVGEQRYNYDTAGWEPTPDRPARGSEQAPAPIEETEAQAWAPGASPIYDELGTLIGFRNS
jgi:hypothetical protein